MLVLVCFWEDGGRSYKFIVGMLQYDMANEILCLHDSGSEGGCVDAKAERFQLPTGDPRPHP